MKYIKQWVENQIKQDRVAVEAEDCVDTVKGGPEEKYPQCLDGVEIQRDSVRRPQTFGHPDPRFPSEVICQSRRGSTVWRIPGIAGMYSEQHPLSRALSDAERKYLSELQKNFRVARSLSKQQENSIKGVAARKAKAEVRAKQVLELHTKGKRRSIIAARVGITVQQVGNIIRSTKNLKVT